MLDIPRVARRGLWQIERRAAIGEFMGCRFADQHRAGSSQLLGASGVGVRDVVLQQLRLAGRRYALGVDDVFEPDRDAV